jgi:dienelactone hydrolase
MKVLEQFNLVIEHVDLPIESRAPGGEYGYRGVPGLLYRRAEEAVRRPVICLHGRGASKYSTLYECSRLASRGYLTLSFDLPGHGERARFAGGPEGEEQRLEVVRAAVADVRAAADLLQARADVLSGTLALTGFSMGAVVALLIAAQDPRIGAVVAFMGAPLTQPEALIGPDFNASVLFVAGTRDPAFPAETIAKLHAMLVERRPDLDVELRQYDVGHTTTAEIEHAAYDWLEERYKAL